MDSSEDIIDDSLDNSKVNKNSSANVSLPPRSSYDNEVEESFVSDASNGSKISQSTPLKESTNSFQTPQRNNSIMSSDDEDINFGSVARSARRVRRIASDSDDEFEQDHVNSSFTNHRPLKLLDSEEEENEGSDSSLNEPQNLSIQKEIETEIGNYSSDSPREDNQSKEIEDLAGNISSVSLDKKQDLDSSLITDDTEIRKSIKKSAEESFRTAPQESSDSEESIVSIHSESDDDDLSLKIIEAGPKKPEINTGAVPKLQQPTIEALVQKMSKTEFDGTDNRIYCTAAEFANQSSKLANLRTDIIRSKNVLRTANLPSLPDQGQALIYRLKNLEKQLIIEEEKLKKMVVQQEAEKPRKTSWEQLQANAAYVVPNTLGKQAMNTYTTQKTLTMDRLKHLHDSLATCPTENTLAEDPKGLKVELMTHQKRALAWLVWREKQKPAGGILADDMGLGKTLTMISLILATKEFDLEDHSDDEEERKKDSKWISRNTKPEGGTLVICPATLIRQWESEIESKLRRALLTVELYHGTKRETKITRLAKYDVVITTYKLAQNEFEKKGPLFNIKWKRLILDEGHVIRNPKSLTSVAICDLKAKARWVLTGTPVHNKELDLYALLKFLRCSPFDDIGVWKRWVANKNAGGQDRLNTVITSILLRRTKEQLQTQGSLKDLPEKNYEVIEVSLDNAEKQVYQKVLVFSRTLFIQFLQQRAEKDPGFTNLKGGDLKQTNDEEYNQMHKKIMQMHGSAEVKSHEILVLLLRLRQICCHPSLITSMLDQENCAADGIEDDGVDVDILDKLSNLNLEGENVENQPPNQTSEEKQSFASQANKLLSTSNPVFAEDRANAKLRAIQKIVEEKVIPNGDKIIIVSQWTNMLNLIMRHLKTAKIRCDILDGKVPVHKRNDIVVNFNNPSSKIKVLLLSLTAGGVGLNLVGANHLLLVDLHWNPQLESQAQDRIYRVGQKKPVHVYKIVTSETIEERIKALQDNKLSMANDILAGVRPGAGSKLSLDDLKMLFSVTD